MSMSGDEAYVLAMDYVDETLEGGGALKGDDGKSAYQSWLDLGNTGTEEDFINSLKGEKGQVGEKGDPGKDGETPVIDPVTKHWFIGQIDTGILAEGKDGESPQIGDNGNWYVGGIDTGVSAKGSDGKSITNIEADEYNNIVVTFSDGSKKNIGQLSIDITADFLGEDGFGNLRYYDGKFQYYHKETSSWVDTSVSPENVYIINMVPQQMKFIRGIYDIELGYNKLKFEEPSDTIIDGQSACIVKNVIIRRKLGSIPDSVDDGELVLNIKREDFYKHINTWYVDDSFTPNLGEVWYYKAFPLSTTGFTNDLSDNEIIVECKDHYLFGFRLDQNESDPASMITYIEDNVNFSSAYMNYVTDTFNYGDWEDFWFIRDLKPCMLNYDGTVAYELNRNDYSLKVDGSTSDIADNTFEGNAMIGIPKVYWKIVDNGDNTANIYISNKKLDNSYHCWSHIDNNGNEIDYCYMPIYNGYSDGTRLRSISGKTPIHSQSSTTEINLAKANNQDDNIIWYTEVFSDRMLINLLLLLIGKSTDTQTVFGNGYYTGGSQSSNPRIATGTMNTKGLFWGINGSSMVGVKVFGIEHWWGNQWRRIAGWINDKGNQKIKMTYGQTDGSTVDGYNTDGSGYITIGCTPSGTSGGYVNKMTVTENGLIPTIASGSATTYYTDGLWFNNSQVDYAIVGGTSYAGLLVGAFYSDLNSLSSAAAWNTGAAVSCKPLV